MIRAQRVEERTADHLSIYVELWQLMHDKLPVILVRWPIALCSLVAEILRGPWMAPEAAEHGRSNCCRGREMTCWLQVRSDDLVGCKCFSSIMLYVARMQRCLLIVSGLRPLWHACVTTTRDIVLTPMTIPTKIHSVDGPSLHANMAGMLG